MNRHYSTHLWWSLVIVTLGLVVCRHLFVSGFPQTMDGELHLARSQQVRIALDQGQWPPFWAPNLNFGLGHPVLIMSYPLFTLLSQPLLGVGLSTMLTTKLLIVGLVIGGGLGMYFWRRQDPWPAAVAAMGYLSLPTISAAIFNRGSVGEITVFGLLPWMLLILGRNHDSKPIFVVRAVLIAMWLVAHNVSVVLFAPVMVILALSQRRSRVYWWSIVVGIGMSLWFWIPALALVSSTSLSTSSLSQLSPGRFRELSALIGLFGADPLVLKPVPETMGWFVTAAGLLGLLLLRRPSKPLFGWYLAFAGSVVLITPASMGLWEQLPLHILQHPIRLLAVTGLAGTQLGYYLAKRYPQAGIVLTVLALLGLGSYYSPGYYLPYLDDVLGNYPLTTTAAHELDPSWYQAMSYASLDTEWFTHGLIRVESDPNALVIYHHVDGSRLEVDLSLTHASTVFVQRLWFPGWHLARNNQEVQPLPPQSPYGLVAVSLPAGTHRLELSQSRTSGAYGWGWLGSLVSVAGLVGGVINTRSPKAVDSKPSSVRAETIGA